MPEPLLRVHDVEVGYPSAAGERLAVAGAALEVAPGETVGVVGESGCGKSSLARAIPGLLPPGARLSGLVSFMSELR